MVECPAVSAWRSATSGQMTMSPRIPSSSCPVSTPGRISSIGKLMTSVGPRRFIHFSWRTAMDSGSMKVSDRSESVLTLSCLRTKVARSTKSFGSIDQSVSLLISILTDVPLS